MSDKVYSNCKKQIAELQVVTKEQKKSSKARSEGDFVNGDIVDKFTKKIGKPFKLIKDYSLKQCTKSLATDNMMGLFQLNAAIPNVWSNYNRTTFVYVDSHRDLKIRSEPTDVH